MRAQAGVESTQPEEFVAELSAFARWFQAMPEDMPDLYELIEVVVRFLEDGTQGRHVLEYLASKAPIYPAVSARLLMTMVQSAPNNWYLRRDALVTEILLSAVPSGDAEAQQAGRQVINLMGELGDYSYQDLLDF